MPDSIARFLLARIGEEIKCLAMMFGFDQPGRCGAACRCCRSGTRFCIAHPEFSAHFGIGIRCVAHIDPAHIGFGDVVLIMDRGCANCQRLRSIGPTGATARIEHPLTDTVDFIINNNKLWIEQARTAQDRIAEAKRAANIINVIIDMTHQCAAFDNTIRA